MALKIAEIDSREKLRDYLQGKPAKLSQLIASRVALRVLPILAKAQSFYHHAARQNTELTPA